MTLLRPLLYAAVQCPALIPGVNPRLAITNVTVIDVARGAAVPGRTVVVVGNRIACADPSGAMRLPQGTPELNGQGRFLIPGLWDLHAHTGTAAFYFPLYIANGVTGIRDMGGDDADPSAGNFSFPFDSIRVWREAVRGARLLGPRMFAAGVVLDGPSPWPGTLGISSPDDARRKVDSLRRAGVDFIKVTNGMPRDSYYAIADEARRVGVWFVGHTPSALNAREAADAGQRSIEHLTGLTPACLARSDCDEARGAFVRNGTWQVPTLVAWRHVLFRADSAVSRAPELAYVQRETRRRWDSVTAATPSSPAGAAAAHETFERLLRVVGQMHRAGVLLLAGSDAANPYTVPGFSLHEELRWLVTAGLRPQDALRAATLGAAEYLDAVDSLGTIEPGKIADLVLLSANPLRDIANTTRIAAVVVNGRLVNAAEREGMLRAVRRSIASPVRVRRTAPSRRRGRSRSAPRQTAVPSLGGT